MNTLSPYIGKRIRLAVLDLEKDSALWAKWYQDSEFQQLLNTDAAVPRTGAETRQWIQENAEEGGVVFSVRLLEDDRIIGFVELGAGTPAARNAYLGVGIGERDFWSHGYGAEAIALLLNFAFDSLNLRRVSLDVFEYNERAQRCYEKLGFQHEGRQRQYLNRYGRRWDLIFMGILREEWQEKIGNYDR